MDPYCGRFAPSPTGPLHFGSLLAALASFLDAKAHQGSWLLRIDDLDGPREAPGARDDICHTLERYGLHWDGPVRFQSQHKDEYLDGLKQLRDQDLVFDCACTRREAGTDIYPGTCRKGIAPGRLPRSVRYRCGDIPLIHFEDRIQGHQEFNTEYHCGDFILQRADKIIAYHLATVIDDHAQGVSDIVRGADLLESCVPQLLLDNALDFPPARYAHIATACGEDGAKLSKQAGAFPIADEAVVENLRLALQFLNQDTLGAPDERDELLHWAIAHWNIDKTPRARERRVEGQKRLRD